MRINNLRKFSVPRPQREDQLSLPFCDDPPPAREPVTHRQLIEFGGRCGRAYELIVHQDPRNGFVLAYCLRPITKH